MANESKFRPKETPFKKAKIPTADELAKWRTSTLIVELCRSSPTSDASGAVANNYDFTTRELRDYHRAIHAEINLRFPIPPGTT
jgi:hypothetical protein